MKKLLTIMTLVVATALLFAQDSVLSSWTANSDGKNVVLEWKTLSESNISHFEIERNSQSQQNFKYIATEKARGYSSTYSFKDDNVFMKDDSQNNISSSNFSYRIKIVKKDNRFEYSNQINVVHNISGIQKTWGMIKEMFR